jgi:hypothetical protein
LIWHTTININFFLNMETDSNKTDLVFDGKSISITFHPQDKILAMTFESDSSSGEFRKAWNIALEKIKTAHIHLILLDESMMKIYPKDMDWLMKEKLPYFLQEFGKKIRLAVILSKNYYESVLAEDYTKKLAKEFPEKLQSKFFKSLDFAKSWLTNRPLEENRIDAHNILKVMMLDRIKFSFKL